MSCQARRRWKTETLGSTERPVQTESNSEFQSRLAQMNAERSQQDRLWQDHPTGFVAETNSNHPKILLLDRREVNASPNVQDRLNRIQQKNTNMNESLRSFEPQPTQTGGT